MSKPTNLESLVDEIYLWLSSQLEYMELHFDEVINGKKTVDLKILQLEKLYATGTMLENFLDTILDSSRTAHSEMLKLLDHLIHKLNVRISEYKNLPVVPLSVTPEEEVEEDQVPALKKATEMELAIKRSTEGLESVVSTLIAYDSGVQALKKARTKAMTLKDLMPYETQEIPEELQDVPSRLYALVSRLDTVIYNNTLVKETDK